MRVAIKEKADINVYTNFVESSSMLYSTVGFVCTTVLKYNLPAISVL